MKKLFILFLICTAIFTSCEITPVLMDIFFPEEAHALENADRYGTETTERLVKGLKTKDKEIIKKTFNASLLNTPDLDTKLQNLLNSFDGKVVINSYRPIKTATATLEEGHNTFYGSERIYFYVEKEDGTKNYYDLFYQMIFFDNWNNEKKFGIYNFSIVDGIYSTIINDNKIHGINEQLNLRFPADITTDTGFNVNIGNYELPAGYDAVLKVNEYFHFYAESDKKLSHNEVKSLISNTDSNEYLNLIKNFGKPNIVCDNIYSLDNYEWYWDMDDGNYLRIVFFVLDEKYSERPLDNYYYPKYNKDIDISKDCVLEEIDICNEDKIIEQLYKAQNR